MSDDDMPDSEPESETNVRGRAFLGWWNADEAARISQELLPPQLGRFWRADDYGELEAEIIEVPE